MAKTLKKAPPSVEELIRRHSKARVLHARPVNWIDHRITGRRQLTDRDAIDAMVRQYA